MRKVWLLLLVVRQRSIYFLCGVAPLNGGVHIWHNIPIRHPICLSLLSSVSNNIASCSNCQVSFDQRQLCQRIRPFRISLLVFFTSLTRSVGRLSDCFMPSSVDHSFHFWRKNSKPNFARVLLRVEFHCGACSERTRNETNRITSIQWWCENGHRPGIERRRKVEKMKTKKKRRIEIPFILYSYFNGQSAAIKTKRTWMARASEE